MGEVSVSVALVPDGRFECEVEVFTVTIESTDNNVILGRCVTTVTIIDADFPVSGVYMYTISTIGYVHQVHMISVLSQTHMYSSFFDFLQHKLGSNHTHLESPEEYITLT